ncbi:tripartite tricarboxylate transporter TctB family protein [Dactylosporangium sp. NPDC005555]|uniref:tripartite tricarboxylate transporter TctB family protein n=1 Tax=Dactylosporangium sp. NPDC005555 TaxID=3154889 RepID=UPI0033A3C730
MSAVTPSEREPSAVGPGVPDPQDPEAAGVGTAEPGAATAGPGPLVAGAVLLLAGAALLAMSIASAVQSGVTLGGPTLAPIIVTGLWVVVALAYLAGRIRARGIGRGIPMTWRTPALLLVALVGYSVMLKYTVVGYVLSTMLFVLVAARLMSTRPLRTVIVRDLMTAVGLSLGIYLLFTRLLGIVLPAGVLPL